MTWQHSAGLAQIKTGQTFSDFMLEVAKGNVAGHSAVNKFGRAPNGIQDVVTDVWDRANATPTQSIWLAPTAARIHTIASTSGNDVPGGTGAQSVEVFYLPDWDTVETSEIITGDLNAGIAMSAAAVIIHRMKVIPQVSSTTINAGTITATAADDATVTAQINIGEGQTQMAIYGIPSTQTIYFPHYYGTINKASGATGEINFSFLVNPQPDLNTVVYQVKNTRGLQSTGKNASTFPWKPYFKVAGPAICKIQGIASADDIEASAGFDGIVVNN